MGVEVTAQRPTVEKHYVARILERKDLSEDLWVIKVDPGGPFSFKAGQYATLGVEHEGKRIERAYSIVSSPYEEGLEFFVELVPHGELTPKLYSLQKGDTMLLGSAERADASPSAGDGYGNRTLCKLRAHAIPRLEGRRQPDAGESQAILHPGRKPVVGVWVSRRTGTGCRGSALAEVCCDH